MLTLLYHNILDRPLTGTPVAGHQVTLATFQRHIHQLRSRLLNPRAVHEQLTLGQTPRGVLITFDDGASGVVQAGEALAQLGAMGVVFVCPGAIREGLWFYRLADALVRTTVSRLDHAPISLPLRTPIERRRAYRLLADQLFGLDQKGREVALARICDALRPDGITSPQLTTLDEVGLQRAATTGGLMFANHSWSHSDLTQLPPAELTHEIGSAQEWLAKCGLPILPWFAFPRGQYNHNVLENAARFSTVQFGAHAYEPNPGVLPRMSMYQADGGRLRFVLKTVANGQLYRCWTQYAHSYDNQ